MDITTFNLAFAITLDQVYNAFASLDSVTVIDNTPHITLLDVLIAMFLADVMADFIDSARD